MKRLPGWENKLAESISSAKSKEFTYGSWDCCLSAAQIIETMTGTNLMQGMDYKSEEEAQVLISSLGSDLLSAVTEIAKRAGLEFVEPNFAQRGDLVVVRVNDKLVVGVIGTDARYVVCTTVRGLTQVERGSVVAAWRV